MSYSQDTLRTEDTPKAAILIVNGGESGNASRWIRLCIERIAALTTYSAYHIYVWNNYIGDPSLDEWLLAQPRLTLLSAATYEWLHNSRQWPGYMYHRIPLQRLYHLAREEGAAYIVTLDNDAHPVRSGWLNELLAAVDDGAALAGVWRDEMASSIRPYVHPSCLCTTVDFIESHRLRFDFDTTNSEEKYDTLGHFTCVAEANGLPIYRLQRSNRRSFHYLMGGIYGDTIYHHGAASRPRVLFHSSPSRGRVEQDRNRQLRDCTAMLLHEDYHQFMGWLQGEPVAPDFEARVDALQKLNSEPGWLDSWRQKARLLSIEIQQSVANRVERRVRHWLGQSRLLRRSKRRLLNMVRHRPPAKETHPMFGSFHRENLVPLTAHGWIAGPPHFVGVGPPKAGTTWWHALLVEHPQIVPHRVHRGDIKKKKETQFFLHHQYHKLTADDLAVYQDAFASAPGTICGEFSTQYLGYPTCLEHLREAAPDAKIIVLLRNPIDRFISHLNHLSVNRSRRSFANLNDTQRYLLHTYSFYTEAMLASLYSMGLTRLFRYFEREKVLVLQYEQVVRAPAQELARTYRFLGVDDRFPASGFKERVNTHAYVISKPDTDERKRLAAYFHDDVNRVFALCPEVTPSLWPDFAGQM